jgi:cytochrome c oxidase subunit 2
VRTVRIPLSKRLPRQGMRRWGIVLSAMLMSSILLAACGENSPSILNPQGPVANQESNLFWFILIVATIVFVIVEGLLIYSIVRFRERPNMPLPRQVHGNNTLEIAWTVGPSLFLFAVLVATIYTMFNLGNISNNSPIGQLEVRVVGHQWWWEFDYMNSNPQIVTADELVVPQGTLIHTLLKSDNVIHSFWVPQVTGKTDVVPGHNNDKLFRADTPGTYRGLCTEYCGLNHAHMSFNLIVMTPSDYMTWLSGQEKAAQTPTDAAAVAGMKLFTGSGGCFACHGIVGVNLNSFTDSKAAGLVGPNLTHFGSRHILAGDVLQWSPQSCQVVTDSSGNASIKNPDGCGLYQWLKDPRGVKPENDMVIRQLSPTEIAQLIAYLESLT